MGLNLSLQALTLPDGTEFPGTPQALFDLIAQYEAIIGAETFNGINYGPVEPTADNRDKPWFKTDGSFNPIGWYSWNGLAWTPIPLVLPSGGTADRPSDAQAGQLYEDTDINVTLKYTGSAWVTLDGSPGDVKEVKATTLDDALTINPGWSHDTDSINLYIVGASDGSGAVGPGDLVGANEYTLLLENLPNDAVSLLTGWGIFPGAFQNGSQGPGIFPITTGLGSGATKTTASINPDTQTAIDLRPASIGYYRLVKDS